jgi:hypothetical protein
MRRMRRMRRRGGRGSRHILHCERESRWRNRASTHEMTDCARDNRSESSAAPRAPRQLCRANARLYKPESLYLRREVVSWDGQGKGRGGGGAGGHISRFYPSSATFNVGTRRVRMRHPDIPSFPLFFWTRLTRKFVGF